MNKYNCSELRINNVGETIILQGWVKKIRKLGGLTFIDLGDWRGITQIIVPEKLADIKIASEYVIEITGTVVERKSKNDNLPTGEIEITCESIKVINESETTPFIIKDDTDGLEELRLNYRYLDLRRPVMQKIMRLRSKLNNVIRNFYNDADFVEIETPILSKSTPEGARDYLVPSRVNENMFYALPQSPQVYKQLLMVSGFEKYYQIARVFRDEDLRSERQPEFTQLDVEMSFVNQNDVLTHIEELLIVIFKELKGITIEKIPSYTFDEVMNKYGSDKPDLRYSLEFNDCKELFADCDFNVFANAESLKFIKINDKDNLLSRKKIDQLTEVAKLYKAKGLAWIKYTDGKFDSPIAKFFTEEKLEEFKKAFSIEENDVCLFVADEWETTCNALGFIRIELAKLFDLINDDEYKFCFVVDFPLFEYDKETDRYYAKHHPFTMPIEDQIDTFDKDQFNAKAQAYDVVLNGYEIGGGSIRITNSNIQERMFKALSMDEKEINENFGFLLKAYQYGAPTHAGYAFGMDRLMMILANTNNIRDVIAFPKNQNAKDQTLDSPSHVSDGQLDELNIKRKNG